VPADHFAGRAGVVTGAGAGIGRALAVELARRGARLALWDRDGVALDETAARCRAVGAVVRTDVVDVADRTAVAAATAAVETAFGQVQLVFCLAGVIHTGSVLASAADDVERVFAVNLHGTVHTVTALLPLVLASGGGHVVTTSSAFGLVAVPRYSAYCASKAAVRAFTDALRLELAGEGLPVRVSCVVPGGVRTGIVRAGGFADDEDADAVATRFETVIARTTPEDAALAVLAGVRRGRAQILVGADARAVALLTRLTGNAYQRVLPRLVRRRRAGGTPTQ